MRQKPSRDHGRGAAIGRVVQGLSLRDLSRVAFAAADAGLVLWTGGTGGGEGIHPSTQKDRQTELPFTASDGGGGGGGKGRDLFFFFSHVCLGFFLDFWGWGGGW